MAVSTAGVLAGLPEEEQKKVVAGGAKEAARQARQIRAGKSAVSGPRPSPGRFGVLRVETPGQPESAGLDGVVFLWVATGELAAAVEALEARGFEYAAASLDARLPGR